MVRRRVFVSRGALFRAFSRVHDRRAGLEQHTERLNALWPQRAFTGEAVIPAFVESLPAPPFEDSTPSSVPVETWLLELVRDL